MIRWILSGLAAAPSRAWRAAMAASPLRLWAHILGAAAMTGFAAWQVRGILAPRWPAELASQQLAIAGHGLYATFGIIGLFVVAITLTHVRFRSPGGAEVEVGREPGEPREDPS